MKKSFVWRICYYFTKAIEPADSSQRIIFLELFVLSLELIYPALGVLQLQGKRILVLLVAHVLLFPSLEGLL